MWSTIVSFLALASMSLVQADVFCGLKTCYGAGAYCCTYNSEDCCWVSVFGLWWFWFIWFWFIVFVLTCGIWICVRRRRRLSSEYIVVNQQPCYGSATSVTTAYSQPPPTYSAVVASAPAYTPAYQKADASFSYPSYSLPKWF
ncbi:hypothetical protein ACJMK2_035347 [Sinanodonta woodiana]|uniref:Uncharacterized protein n=1 Tax=Sinanodonta woodiana TaxID=1069815 RepID=A0ABD3WYK5_SINWO